MRKQCEFERGRCPAFQKRTDAMRKRMKVMTFLFGHNVTTRQPIPTLRLDPKARLAGRAATPMDLLSLNYATLVAIIVLLFHVCHTEYRKLFLCATSFVVYGIFTPVGAAILLALTIAVFHCARYLKDISEARKRLLLAGNLLLLLAFLFAIKLLPIFGGRTLPPAYQIALGLGVSYYTFKLVGYLTDVYWGKILPLTSYADFGAAIAFFPQLPAGPIQRVQDFAAEVGPSAMSPLFVWGLRRLLLGYVKKAVVADQIGSLLTFISSVQTGYSKFNWIAGYAYTIQMYADFSALTDIAIGTSALFGIKSAENFAFPFFAPSISEFWRRWHMTLTQWLTDYVFLPLRMLTRAFGWLGLALSIMANMVLIGLWHGFTIGFLSFGVVHGAYLIVDTFTVRMRRRWYRRYPLLAKVTSWLGPILVFNLVSFALVFFRAGTAPELANALTHCLDGLRAPVASVIALWYNYGRLNSLVVAFAIGLFVAFETGSYLRHRQVRLLSLLPNFNQLPAPIRWATYYVGLGAAAALHRTATHFIYVQF